MILIYLTFSSHHMLLLQSRMHLIMSYGTETIYYNIEVSNQTT